MHLLHSLMNSELQHKDIMFPAPKPKTEFEKREAEFKHRRKLIQGAFAHYPDLLEEKKRKEHVRNCPTCKILYG